MLSRLITGSIKIKSNHLTRVKQAIAVLLRAMMRISKSTKLMMTPRIKINSSKKRSKHYQKSHLRSLNRKKSNKMRCLSFKIQPKSNPWTIISTKNYRCLKKWTKGKRSETSMINNKLNSHRRRRRNRVNRCSQHNLKNLNRTPPSLKPMSKSSPKKPKTKSTQSLTIWTSLKRKLPSSKTKWTMKIT